MTAHRTLKAVIFDVDGVLLATPHERAWRAALDGFADPARFTTSFYQAQVAGKPRMDGALAALEGLGVADAAAAAPAYAARKQGILERMIAAGDFPAFPDALRLAQALHARGLKLAAASSSKNAAAMMRLTRLDDGTSLAALLDADLSGHDVPHGKPAPDLFLAAAAALRVSPEGCLVVEDSPAGIIAGRAGGMATLGIARLDDAALLRAAQADLVVTDLDQVDIEALAGGTLQRRRMPSRRSRMPDAMQPTNDPGWVLDFDGTDIRRESGIESRFAIGNGLIGVRAASSVSRGPTWVSWQRTLNWASWPRTYVAGLFDTPNTDPPVPALVPVADWLRVRIHLDGKPLTMRRGTMLTHRRTLDMRRGLLVVTWRHRDPSGAVAQVVSLRLVSQADRALGLQWLSFDLDRDDVEVTLEASFEAAGLGMEPARVGPELGVWRVSDGSKSLAMAGGATLAVGGDAPMPHAVDPLCWTWRWRSVAGQMIALERLVAMVRSDEPESDPGPTASAALQRARKAGGEAVLAAHEAAWAARWQASDVTIEGAPELEREVRFAVYHLNSAANPDDPRVSIGARALTGDAYLGHVFWDTEIYLLPFYIATWPEAARALLMYRFHTLPGARANAAKGGWRGAQYAWESAATGDETTPEHVLTPGGQLVDVLSGKQEHHITADVAYAVWQYWNASGDEAFLLEAGAEILLETARFWTSRTALGADGKRHIRCVMGPDEYHEGVDDSAYTNAMARWNIARALDAGALLRERWPQRWADLSARLALDEVELLRWRETAATLVTGVDPATGVIEQFAGFFALEPIDLAQYPDRSVPMDVQLGAARAQRTQVVKQADVVALLALLPEAFDATVARANFRTYEPRCGHGSSLSRAMHAVVAARLGETATAYRYLRETAEVDLSANVADSAGGVHIAALGGLWQAVVMGFGGLSLTGEHLSILPQLPPQWLGLSFMVCWRGRRVRFRIQRDGQVDATLEAGDALTVLVHGGERVLQPSGEAPGRA